MLRWGGGLVAALVAVAAAAPLLTPYDPAEQLDPAMSQFEPPGTVLAAVHLADGSWRLAERARRVPEGLRLESGSRSELLQAGAVANLSRDGVADSRLFLLGSDQFGRDLAARMLYGARVSLGVAAVAVLLALTLGLALGALAALGGRLLDTAIMRGLDAMLAFPPIFLMIALAALLHPGTWLTVVILGATGWMGIGRLTRAELLGLQRRDFVLAARGLGLHPVAIVFRHLLPNALAPVLIQATLMIGQVIAAESTLSFLGLGVQPPTASWGNMIAEGQGWLFNAWWIATFPGAALALTVVAFNLLGDGLRDALDPRGGRLALPAPPLAAGAAAPAEPLSQPTGGCSRSVVGERG